MNLSSTYLLNVALHAALLSVFTSLLLVCLRLPEKRAFVAIVGLMAVGVLPWITALRPAAAPRIFQPAAGIQEPPSGLALWTVATVPMKTTVEVEIPPTSQSGIAPAAGRVYPNFPYLFNTLWAVGSGIALLKLCIAWLQVVVWRKSLAQPDDASWSALQQLVPEAPARGRFRICQGWMSPCVTGFWRPLIVIPSFLLDAGSKKKLGWALRHEIGHWRTGDSRWMLIFNFIRCLNWWNPLVHLLISRWDDAREQLCDLQATGPSENRAAYGAFLIAMPRQVSKQPPLAVAMAKSRQARRLKRRLVGLLESAGSGSPVGKGFASLSAGLVVVLAVAVSVMRIGAAEEAVIESREEEAARPQAITFQPEKFHIDYWMIISKSASGRKSGEILKDHEMKEFLKTAEDQGCIAVHTTGKLDHGENKTFETRYDRKINLWSQKDRPSFADPIGNGIQYESRAIFENQQISLTTRATYRFFPGSGFPISLTPAEPFAGGSDFLFKKADVSARLNLGEVVCVDLGEVEPGTFAQVFSKATPLTAEGDSVAGSPGQLFKRPSVDVKGRVRISGTRVSVPAADLKADLARHPHSKNFPPVTDSMNWVIQPYQEVFENVLGAEIEKLGTVELPLIEFRQPWLSLPGLKFSAYLSEDHKWINLTMIPGTDVLDQEIKTLPFVPPGIPISFKLRSGPKTESRVFFKIEAVKP
ncbi:M56 family metallopeptidase [Luteolibacter yonseiensis]|uniref:M56 family metallopeptidase n=1 Tax=Luteolibacter yonseiensis TaxID=1144680 RepID=A0A934VAY0_9BACT|nr:M56 family metallopeptidase [Luteolibacter yonseiensis]MBK1814824.1 M56 family metallopeptidase [Luteolibacter yonseiensis]